MLASFHQKKADLKFQLETFEEETLPEAINRLTYGAKANKYMGKGTKKHIRTFFLLNDDYRFIQWISNRKPYTKTRICLTDIKEISREIPKSIKNQNGIFFLRLETDSLSLQLDFSSKKDRDYFHYGVQYFAVQASHHNFIEKRADVVKHLAGVLFLDADKDGSKQLSYEETERLLKELHVNVNKKYLRQIFQMYDVNGNKQIDQSEFINIMRDISQKKELHPIFEKYCKGYTMKSNDQEGLMTISEYQKFCQIEQKINITPLQITELFSGIQNGIMSKKSINLNQQPSELRISFYQFSNFLFNLDNGIFEPRKMELYQDMDRPLSDYFISSSHNTYLMANQLTGESSCQAYINALLSGCRCVEIDSWDGDKGDPIVYHGHTLTSKIMFKDVIETINQYAFMASPFPVILSLENHCSAEQTKRMAEYIRNIFKEKLYIIPKDYKKMQYQKSPNELRRKILIKSKGSVEKAVSQEEVLGYVSDSDEDDDDNEKNLSIIQKSTLPDFSQNQQMNENQSLGKKKTAFGNMKPEDQELMLASKRTLHNQDASQINQNINQKDVSPQPSIFFKQKDQGKLSYSEDQSLMLKNETNSNLVPSHMKTQDTPMMGNYQQNNGNERILSQQQLTKINNSNSKAIIRGQGTLGSHYENDDQLISNHKIEDSIQKQISTLANIAAIDVAESGAALGTKSLSNLPIQQKKSSKKAGGHKEKVAECKEMIQITTMFGCHMNVKELNRVCWYISSVSEIKYQDLLGKFPEQLIQIFKKSFARLYPAGLRVDSSNYDPIKCFLSGVQIVALNFQTKDLPMLLNQAKFMENGGFGSGYVLKPDYMLHNTKKTYAPVLMKKIIKTIRVQVISGQQLRPENYENDTFDVVDPYVQIFVRGTDYDESINKPQATEVVSDNGFHPVWNSPVYEFNLACPELAMLVFRVMDSDVGSDTQLGIYAAPIDSLRQGYRVVPIRSKSTHQTIEHCFILVKVEIIEKMNRPCMKNIKH